MENQKGNSALKAIILVLSLLLFGSLFYIYKLTTKTEELETTVTSVKTEKEAVVAKLEDLKATYDAAIAENTTISDELIQEREKVVKLLKEVQSAKGNASAMAKYKQQYDGLQTKMKSLIKEVEVLKTENKALTTNLDSTKVVLEESKNYTKTLATQNEELAKTVDRASKLSVLNLKASAYKLKGSGKQVETDKASRADILKISFTIAENAVAKSGDKVYYVQVIDSKNNVLGERVNANFGDKSLTYSFTSTVKYENKTVEVSQDLAGKDFEKGTFFVNVFDKGELISKTSFQLK